MKVRLPNGWEPRPYQRKVWAYLERGGREAVCVWHRRSGKDDVALHRTACAAFERIGNYWHMLPEYEHARKALWLAINPHTGTRRIDEAFPPALRKRVDDRSMMIELINGSIWQVIGSDNYNSLIGSPPVGVVFSEWSVADPRAQGYLRPILLENNGWSLYIYTSRGYNHGWSTYEGALKRTDSFAQRLTAAETGVFSAEQLASELQAYIDQYGEDAGDALFRQEYYCDFSAANFGAILGRALETADREGRVFTEDAAYDPTGPGVFVSSDIGYRDAAAFWFWQPRLDGLALVAYREGTGMDAEEWIPELDAVGIPIDKLWLPHDARTKTFQSKRSAVETFLGSGIAKTIGIVSSTTDLDKINAARRIIPHCRFAPGTEEGIAALRQWCFEFDEERRMFGKKPKEDWTNHCADAFAYGAQKAPMPAKMHRPAPVNPPIQLRKPVGPRLDDFVLAMPRAVRL